MKIISGVLGLSSHRHRSCDALTANASAGKWLPDGAPSLRLTNPNFIHYPSDKLLTVSTFTPTLEIPLIKSVVNKFNNLLDTICCSYSTDQNKTNKSHTRCKDESVSHEEWERQKWKGMFKMQRATRRQRGSAWQCLPQGPGSHADWMSQASLI